MFQYKEDLRIRHTKEFVFEALQILLKKYEYHNISISMIIKKSGIGRTTFYRHFYSKDDILREKLIRQSLEMVDLLNNTYDLSVYDKDIYQKIRLFFQYWNDHPEIINIIIYLDKTQLLYQTWISLLVNIFQKMDMGLSKEISKDYVAHFAIGGLTSLLIEWFNNNRKESIDYISKHFHVPNTQLTK